MSCPSAMRLSSLFIIALIVTAGCGPTNDSESRFQYASYDDLVTFCDEWREFQKPVLVDGIPDYSEQAMGVQYRELAAYQSRLKGFDVASWPVSEQVDYHLIRAEMNGLAFDHRVLRPWANNPAFYVMIFLSQSDVPAHEGPVIANWIDTWEYDFPLSVDDATGLAARISTIPGLLGQARRNLTGNQKDLWVRGIENMRGQMNDLDILAKRVEGISADLDGSIEEARAATDEFVTWLESETPSKTGPSGVGVDNYNWYLKNVHLVPFKWEEEVAMIRRELARAWSSLKLEENRNRDLPPLTSIASAEEYEHRLNAAVDEFMAFLDEEEIMTTAEYMEPAQRAKIGRFSESDGPRSFFSEVTYHNELVMRTHNYHWIELARIANDPHASPMRQKALLYNIFDGRAEGLATAMEKMMMHAGLLDEHPQARELIWILLAQRAARALSSLYMHSNDFTIDEAVQFASKWTPRGWLQPDGNLVWFEQHLYLQQPFYGSSYVTGKIELERLMAERARQLGEEFTLKGFMDELNSAGVIPVSLLRWEIAGRDDDLKKLLED